MPARPNAIAFDLFQTVFSLEPLRECLKAVGLPKWALELWFAQTLRDGLTLAATATFQPFFSVATGTLRSLLVKHGRADDEHAVSQVMDAFATLPAKPDVAEAMRTVRDGGVRVLALTNGGGSNAEILLQKAGLSQYVERLISIDEPRAWKPRSELYRYAAQTARLEPAQLALVAVHAWDCHGASRAGLTTAWVGSSDNVFNPVFDAPDVRGATLVEVCQALLHLPAVSRAGSG